VVEGSGVGKIGPAGGGLPRVEEGEKEGLGIVKWLIVYHQGKRVAPRNGEIQKDLRD